MLFETLKSQIDTMSSQELQKLQEYITMKLSQETSKIGIIADIHGDYDSFQKALSIFDAQNVQNVVCVGDIVDRGSDADKIIKVLQQRQILCIAGNHDRTVVANQDRWRQHPNQQRMRELGRVVSDTTIDFLIDLPDTMPLNLANKKILIAHGTPWSDVLGVFPDSRQGSFDRIYRDYSAEYDVIILGHTHHPMHAMIQNLHIINSGSVYSVTSRDSNTCAIFDLDALSLIVYDIQSAQPIDISITQR
ncbi:MAG: metallophosphoesterase family protein [Chloroflexota bacterium]